MGLRRSMLEAGVTVMRALYRFRKVENPQSILVLRNNDMGDLVVTTPLFQALRMTFPDAYIAVAVGSWSKELIKGNPYISEVIECNAPWHNHRTGRISLGNALKYIFDSAEVSRLNALRFDVGIDVLGSPFGSMLFIHLHIPIRLGRKGYAGGHTGATAYTDFLSEVSVADNAVEFVRLLKRDANINIESKPQLFVDAQEIQQAKEMWQAIQGAHGNQRRKIVVAPGAGLLSKQWPVERFAELIGSLSMDSCGYVVGSQEESPLGEQIVRGLNSWNNVCGKLSLRQSMALISQADLVICNSTLTMHLAAAFNKPCVVILAKEHDPKSHAALWEVKGLHHQLFPVGDEQYVQVSAVEIEVKRLLQSLQV
jgi:ADP-heptose:LPS heptosyltransferase